MVHDHGLLVGGVGGDELSVLRRLWIGIDDGEEIVALAVEIAGPGKQVMALLRKTHGRDQAKEYGGDGGTQHGFL